MEDFYTVKKFRVNQFLSVKLEKETWGDARTTLYVAGQPFIQCKFLLLNIPITEVSSFDQIASIDEAAEMIDGDAEQEIRKIEIPPEVEFWGHCSNLQVWYENNYDTRLIHSNLAFPLLRKLTEAGDPLAKEVFKGEIIDRYKNGTEKTREFLRAEGFVSSLPLDERLNLLLDSENFSALLELSEQVIFDQNPLPTIVCLLDCINIEQGKIIELNLSNLDLTEFPNAILKMKSLKFLHLSNNCLKVIPEGISNLDSLIELSLGFNQISNIPDSICNITSLEKLWLSENKISELPSFLGNIINLKMIRLSENQLNELPESICNLKHLTELYLSGNNLTTLPKCIKNLHALSYLDISRNPIKKESCIKDTIRNIIKVIMD